MIDAAKIVGIGESAHGLREFGFVRHAVTRFLLQDRPLKGNAWIPSALSNEPFWIGHL